MDNDARMMYNRASMVSEEAWSPIERDRPLAKEYQPVHRGIHWSGLEGVSPRLLCALRSAARTGFIGGATCSSWLMNYNFTPFGRYALDRDELQWKPRYYSELHIYSPGTYCLEDLRNCPNQIHTSGFCAFLGGELTVLKNLTAATGYYILSDSQNEFGPLFEELLDFGVDLGLEGFWSAQGSFYKILSLVTRLSQQVAEHQPNLVRQVHRYFQDHLSEVVSREDLAKHLNVSVSSLSHRYQDAVGESVMTTLTRMRINQAKSLLVRGYNLKMIASQTGFCDPFHLSKTFKKWEGISVREHLARSSRG